MARLLCGGLRDVLLNGRAARHGVVADGALGPNLGPIWAGRAAPIA
jgi:hypothetical protein